jgi:hypothetical protein
MEAHLKKDFSRKIEIIFDKNGESSPNRVTLIANNTLARF